MVFVYLMTLNIYASMFKYLYLFVK